MGSAVVDTVYSIADGRPERGMIVGKVVTEGLLVGKVVRRSVVALFVGVVEKSEVSVGSFVGGIIGVLVGREIGTTE